MRREKHRKAAWPIYGDAECTLNQEHPIPSGRLRSPTGELHVLTRAKTGYEHERVADFVHGSLLQNVTLADRKAGILFTLVSAALLFLFTRMPGVLSSAAGVLWLVVVALLVLAASLAFSVIFPRQRRHSENMLFWGGVADWPNQKAYIQAVANMESECITEAKLEYCYNLARICKRKFWLLRCAMMATAVGLVLFLVSLVMRPELGGSMSVGLY